jgi:hypothetical protein
VKLFDPKNVVGVFRGFSDSGMEFHADLVLPYREQLQSIPMHGQFVLVQLEHEDEAVLGRITSVAAEGRLVSPIGEDYAIRAVRDDRPIPGISAELRLRAGRVWQVQPDQAAVLAAVRDRPDDGIPITESGSWHDHLRSGRRVLLARRARAPRSVRRA